MLSRKSVWRPKHSLIVSSPSQRALWTTIGWVRAFRAACAMLLILVATAVVLPAQTPTETDQEQGKPLHAPGVCPVPQLSPPSASNTLIVPQYKSYRPLVDGDYVVIEYNASQKKPVWEKSDPNAGLTSWTDYKRIFDYRRLNNTTNIIGANGSFLPVIYTKEKVAIRVCGLHFTDVLTVTTSPNGVPEGGADIRGATPVTPPASLSSTLDMLQSGVATGGTTNLPGLGLNAPTQVSSLAISGITPGSLGAEDQTPGKYPTYTPATVTASGKQVALLLYSVAANAKELTRLIGRTEGEAYPAIKIASEGPMWVETPSQVGALLGVKPPEVPKDGKPEESVERIEPVEPGGAPKEDEPAQAQEAREEEKEKAAPGSVKGVAYILNKVLDNVKTDDADGTDTSSSAAFDKDMTDIQNVNAQVSSLASALSSQAFASNAITLLNNYATLIGVLDLANMARSPQYCQGIPPGLQPGKLGADDVKKITSDQSGQSHFVAGTRFGSEPNQGQQSRKGGESPIDPSRPKGPEALRAPQTTSLCAAHLRKQKITDFWNSVQRTGARHHS